MRPGNVRLGKRIYLAGNKETAQFHHAQQDLGLARTKLPYKWSRIRGNTSSVLAHASFQKALALARSLAARTAGPLLAVCIALPTLPGQAAPLLELHSTDISREQYERAVRHHTPKSSLPSQGEAEVLLQLPRELFTDDAWEGMQT